MSGGVRCGRSSELPPLAGGGSVGSIGSCGESARIWCAGLTSRCRAFGRRWECWLRHSSPESLGSWACEGQTPHEHRGRRGRPDTLTLKHLCSMEGVIPKCGRAPKLVSQRGAPSVAASLRWPEHSLRQHRFMAPRVTCVGSGACSLAPRFGGSLGLREPLSPRVGVAFEMQRRLLLLSPRSPF